MNSIFKKQNTNPSAEDIAGWESQYGELCKWATDDNRVAYLRTPTKKELTKAIKKARKKSGYFDEVTFMKHIFKMVFLGGCKELLNDKEELLKLKDLWQIS
jgi:hypothetical protein